MKARLATPFLVTILPMLLAAANPAQAAVMMPTRPQPPAQAPQAAPAPAPEAEKPVMLQDAMQEKSSTGFSINIPMPGSGPQDNVAMTLTTEGWVTTKTARVTMAIEAAVSGDTAGTMRTTMGKAVNDIVKADWRLIGFNRGQDQTGMERWSALYEARIAENELGDIATEAKKASKAGMQINVANVDFTPTLAEVEAALSDVRSQLYKQANDQVAVLNKELPGRNFRVATVDFDSASANPAQYAPAPMMGRAMMMAKGGAPEMDMAEMPLERSKKLVISARVTFVPTEAPEQEKPAPTAPAKDEE